MPTAIGLIQVHDEVLGIHQSYNPIKVPRTIKVQHQQRMILAQQHEKETRARGKPLNLLRPAFGQICESCDLCILAKVQLLLHIIVRKERLSLSSLQRPRCNTLSKSWTYSTKDFTYFEYLPAYHPYRQYPCHIYLCVCVDFSLISREVPSCAWL